VYSCGAMELPLVGLITGSVNSAMMPNLVTLCGQGKPLAALAMWQEAVRKCSLVIFPCFAIFIFLAKDFLLLIYGTGYIMAAWPFVIYLCLLPIRIAVYNTLFRAVGKTKPIAVSAALNLVLNVVLSTGLAWMGGGSLLSFIGPSTGAVLSNIIAACYLLWELSKLFNVPISTVMRWKELGRIFGLSLLCGLFLWLIPLPIPQLLFKFITKAFIYAILFVIAMVLTKSIKSDEWELLLFPLAMIRKKLRKAYLNANE
jgi:O-antigen/teichoic acid export membrane protein